MDFIYLKRKYLMVDNFQPFLVMKNYKLKHWIFHVNHRCKHADNFAWWNWYWERNYVDWKQILNAKLWIINNIKETNFWKCLQLTELLMHDIVYNNDYICSLLLYISFTSTSEPISWVWFELHKLDGRRMICRVFWCTKYKCLESFRTIDAIIQASI